MMFSDEDDLVIIVDHREVPSGIIDYLEKDSLFVIRKAQLSCGDYLIGDLVIERKTGPDLFKSLADGRFFSQIFLMKRSYKKRMLLFEDVRAINALEAVITKVTSGLQVPILYSNSVEHSALLLKRIAIQQFKFNTGSPVIRHVQRTNDIQFQLRYLLLGLPMIGIKRADSLLKKFGSLQSIFTASEEELARTPDIGPHLAHSIKELLARSAPS